MSSFQRCLLSIACFFPLLANAEGVTIFSDVPEGIWYENAVAAFLDSQYLDSTQGRFRGSEKALRGEFVKLVVELNGGILVDTPTVSHFSDVAPGDWFFPYFEEAAREGWVKGDQDCFPGKPCRVRPRESITRAEAAAIIRRAFGKKPLGIAPAFKDNPAGNWFSEFVQIAADHCILQGDDASRSVRPHDALNRAEMVVMLSRVDEGKRYPNC